MGLCLPSVAGRPTISSRREMARWTHDVTLLCCALSQYGHLALVGDGHGGIHFLDVVGVAEAANAFAFNTPLSSLAEREVSDLKHTDTREQHPRALALPRWLFGRK